MKIHYNFTTVRFSRQERWTVERTLLSQNAPIKALWRSVFEALQTLTAKNIKKKIEKYLIASILKLLALKKQR